MSCTLRAGGTDFEVDVFLHESTLAACAVFRRGNPDSQRHNPKVRAYSDLASMWALVTPSSATWNNKRRTRLPS
jgi:hypothetical protein